MRLDQISEVQRRQRLPPEWEMTELRTVEGCSWIFTEEGEEVIHQLAEMRVAETHTNTRTHKHTRTHNASQTKLFFYLWILSMKIELTRTCLLWSFLVLVLLSGWQWICESRAHQPPYMHMHPRDRNKIWSGSPIIPWKCMFVILQKPSR